MAHAHKHTNRRSSGARELDFRAPTMAWFLGVETNSGWQNLESNPRHRRAGRTTIPSRSPLTALRDQLAETRHDFFGRRVLQKYFVNAHFLQRDDIFVRHDATRDDDHVISTFLFQPRKNLRKYCHLDAR